MKIGGFIKFSLIDYPGKISAVIFTQGCNFRCLYCHNPQLVYPQLFTKPIPFEDIWEFLKKRRNLLEGVVFCGGEPTLQADILETMEKVRALGYYIKLDTNGSRPDILKRLLPLLDYIALDIKAPFGTDKYSYVCGTKVNEEAILLSIELIRSSKVAYEFRTTFHPEYMPTTLLEEIRKFIRENEKYVIQHAQNILWKRA